MQSPAFWFPPSVLGVSSTPLSGTPLGEKWGGVTSRAKLTHYPKPFLSKQYPPLLIDVNIVHQMSPAEKCQNHQHRVEWNRFKSFGLWKPFTFSHMYIAHPSRSLSYSSLNISNSFIYSLCPSFKFFHHSISFGPTAKVPSSVDSVGLYLNIQLVGFSGVLVGLSVSQRYWSWRTFLSCLPLSEV